MDDEKDFCPQCGKRYEEDDDVYQAFDLQNGYNELWFCSLDCLNTWVNKKITGMVTALVIGVVLAGICLLDTRSGLQSLWFAFLLLPYMIRQTWKNPIFNGFINFIIMFLACMTVVYPFYKIYQEIRDLVGYKNTINNSVDY